MARRTHRIAVKRNSPDKLIKLSKLIYGKHIQEAGNSPLNIYKMDDFNDNVISAEKMRMEAIALKKKSEALMQESRKLLGIEKGQTSHSKNTILNMTASSATCFWYLATAKRKASDSGASMWLSAPHNPSARRKKGKFNSAEVVVCTEFSSRLYTAFVRLVRFNSL